jgi:hypothetical protein
MSREEFIKAELATYSDQHIINLFLEVCEYLRQNDQHNLNLFSEVCEHIRQHGFTRNIVRNLVHDVITTTLDCFASSHNFLHWRREVAGD